MGRWLFPIYGEVPAEGGGWGWRRGQTPDVAVSARTQSALPNYLPFKWFLPLKALTAVITNRLATRCRALAASETWLGRYREPVTPAPIDHVA